MQAKSRVFDSPKAQQGASHEGIEEEFVQSHMRLLTSYPRDQFDGLLGSEGIHGLLLKGGIPCSEKELTVLDGDEKAGKEIGARAVSTRNGNK